MRCDETCSCGLGESCLGRRFPEVWGAVMRAHWESGDPVRRRFVRDRSGFAYTTADSRGLAPIAIGNGVVVVSEADVEVAAPLTSIPPTPQPAPPVHGVPLAGDLVSAAANRLGADRVAQWVAKRLGARDCGCESRRKAMNRMDATLRRYLGKRS